MGLTIDVTGSMVVNGDKTSLSLTVTEGVVKLRIECAGSGPPITLSYIDLEDFIGTVKHLEEDYLVFKQKLEKMKRVI